MAVHDEIESPFLTCKKYYARVGRTAVVVVISYITTCVTKNSYCYPSCLARNYFEVFRVVVAML